MSTDRTMTQPEEDTVNWLSSIDPQKHETAFKLSFIAVLCVDYTAVLTAVLHQCSSLLLQIVVDTDLYCSNLFCFFFLHLFLFCFPKCFFVGMECNFIVSFEIFFSGLQLLINFFDLFCLRYIFITESDAEQY